MDTIPSRSRNPTSGELERLEPLVYSPLSSPSSFRILTVLPGLGNDVIDCKLQESTLEAADSRYLALSYAWGSIVLDKLIVCNGRKVNITSNLHSALQRLRQAELPLNLWCDALCINQAQSLAALCERGAQVSMMNRIFRGACRVVADLGPADEYLDEAVQAIQMLLSMPKELWTGAEKRADPIGELGLPAFSSTVWRTLEKFASRPWFRRVWCVQEFVLARDIRFIIGDYAFTREQVFLAVYRILLCFNAAGRVHQLATWDTAKWNLIHKSASSYIQTYLSLLSSQKTTQRGLCELFNSASNLDATDPRDKIYALYGMVQDLVIRDLPVDYSEPLPILAQRASSYFITKGHEVYVLSHAGGIRRGCASWCLDMDGSAGTLPSTLGSLVNVEGRCNPYRACGSTIQNLRLGQDTSVLLGSGFIFDGITDLGERFPADANLIFDANPSFADMCGVVIEILKWINNALFWSTRRFGEDADQNTLWRTMIADHNHHLDDTQRDFRNRASSEFGKNFAELLSWKTTSEQFLEEAGLESLTPEVVATHLIPEKACLFWLCLVNVGSGRRLAQTECGTMALVPKSAELDDRIAIFEGVPVPFVLRKEDGHYLVVGPCYVHGMMDGEALELDVQVEDIELR